MMIDRGRAPRSGGRLQPGRLIPLLLAGLAAATGMLIAGSGSAGAAAAECPSVNRPNALRIVAGSPQTAQLAKPFETNLQVELANSNGCPLTGPLAGVSVTFTAPASGASGTFATTGTNRVTVGTDATGTATAPAFTANDTAGSYGVRAGSDYGNVELSLTNTAGGVPASLSAAGQSHQEATVNSRYGQPLQAQVLDADGRPVQGATVIFSLGTGATGAGASFVGGGTQATETTKADGRATSPPFVANGTPGRFTATASTAGVSAAATFTLVNHAAALTVVADAPATQTATVGTRYRRPLRTRVLDAAGQPIEGATVTFTLPQAETAPGASFVGGTNQATATADANGKASSPLLVSNSVPGRFTATATVVGGTPVRYTLRNLAARLTAVGSVQAATVGSRYRQALRARVLDARGQPLAGVTVTFTLPQAENAPTGSFVGGSNQATATTGADGRVASPAFVANDTAGRFTATATATVAGGKPVSYELENRVGPPARIVAGAASGQSTPFASRFPIRLAVTVTDKSNNPVGGALVIFAAPAHGPSGSFTRATGPARIVRVKIAASGIAVAPPFSASGSAGGYAVTARVAGTPLRTAFALVNRPRR
jgi:protocatechuate 3,4-dioxygenase beta subunit